MRGIKRFLPKIKDLAFIDFQILTALLKYLMVYQKVQYSNGKYVLILLL